MPYPASGYCRWCAVEFDFEFADEYPGYSVACKAHELCLDCFDKRKEEQRRQVELNTIYMRCDELGERLEVETARRKRAEAKLRALGVDVGENGLEEEEKKTKPPS
jgi:hypothetical protein